jgi:hypothetical protein
MWSKYGKPIVLAVVFLSMIQTLYAISVALFMTDLLTVIATGVFFTALWTDMFFEYLDERREKKVLDNQQAT